MDYRSLILCYFVLFFDTSSATNDVRVRSFDQEVLASSILTKDCDGNTDNNEFQQVTVQRGNVYVGATNTILQFSSSLNEISRFENGPGNDSSYCGGPPYCDLGNLCQSNQRCSNNYNRLLIPYRDRLLACGTLHEVCDLLELEDIANIYGIPRELKCRDENTVQYVAVGSRNLESPLVGAIQTNAEYPDRDLLYLGRPDHFIQVLFAPSEPNPYFTQVDQFIETAFNRVAKYHLAWTTADYGYMLWTNSTTEETKLSRYCNSIMSESSRDSFREEFDSPSLGPRTYTEISIQCRGSNMQVLSSLVTAKYIFGQLFVLYQDGSETAVCATNITHLNQQFDFVRDRCWNSTEGSLYAKYMNPGSNCTHYDFYEEEWSTCGLPDNVYYFLNGNGLNVIGLIPVNFDLLMSYDFIGSEAASTFTLTAENDIYVVFVGTTAGNIFKFRIDDGTHSVTEKISSGNNLPTLDSLVVDETNQNLYAISNTTLYRVRVDACSQLTTCTACIESRDPFCGWCVRESMCTRRTDCSNIGQEQRWIGPSMTSDRCPRVSVVQPDLISVGSEPTKINLTFAGTALPNTLEYTCEFTAQNNQASLKGSPLEDLSNGSRFGNCEFPATTPDLIATFSDHNNVTLRVVSNGTTLASGNLRVYQCSKVRDLNQYSMCSSCVTSEWGCSWCAYTGTCNPSPTCDEQLVIEQSQCPNVTGFNFERYIPTGQSKVFFLRTSFLPGNTHNYMCQYNLCGKTNLSNAQYFQASELVQCRASPELLTCDVESSPIQVFLRRDDYFIDTPSIESVTGKLYNCSAASIRDSCTRCMGFRRECSQCVWCPTVQDTGLCVDVTECPIGDAVTDIRYCESPVIESFSPTNGPFQGGTEVTILGRNLGSRVSDITRVRIGRVDCEIIPERYETSRRIVCLTGMANTNGDSGMVAVFTNYSDGSFRSNTIFQYRRVMVTRFSPRTVISETPIVVSGRMLSVGNNAILYFDGNRMASTTCTNRQERSMFCSLPPVQDHGNYTLMVQIDGFMGSFSNRIQIVESPTIIDQGDLIGFRSAGGMVTIELSSVEGVQMITLRIGSQPEQNCDIDRDFKLARCHVPPLTSSSSRKRRQAPNEVEATLTVNGVYEISVGSVEYYEDPSLTQLSLLNCQGPSIRNDFNASYEQISGPSRTIQIPGKNFNSIMSSNEDYTVRLSSGEGSGSIAPIPCNVTFIESTSLFCRATEVDLIAFMNRKITIEVSIGELNLTMPNVQYCTEDKTTTFAIAITIPIVILLLLVILVLLYRQRIRIKKQARERALIMKKLDDLENKTREHARNAYYELQVGYMNNLSDNITRRITYRRPELYFIQTLFQLAGDHPVLDNAALKQETANSDAIKEWTRLLKNKEFLMTFIRTLEEQKKFTVQEKGNVASLLVVCLFSDMAYFTNIMFDLLTELIQKHIQKNPKLLLRRSESVVEKMVSHWLSITLYDECIMGKAGEPVFLLTKAIHYLVSSAPCDVIAHKSVNSLNESTLLSTEIRYSTKLLLASIQEENGKVTKPVEVSVVDVDTISQVKQKIIDEVYKDKPYSECPKPDDYDFELLCNGSMGEGIVLSDVDSTSERKQNFTKLNTIKHYNVNDKARVVLRPVGILRQGSLDSKTPLLNGNGNHIYHLIDDESSSEDFIEGISNRPFQEIFLTRMVRSKSTLQEYVDGVFKSILSPEPMPLAVRYFFQFLDREAARHRINDNEVVHIWKTNSLLLRYWVNVLKNPEFIFDINKTAVVDSCLSVITQAFMDACSTTTSRKLNYDSPSNKLLYAKDAEHYQKMVNEFFLQISNTKWIADEEINEMLKRTSQQYAHKFNARVACQELYKYLFKYKEQIITAIRNEENEDLAKTVEKVAKKMQGKNSQTTIL